MPRYNHSITDILGEKGGLARSLIGFEFRPSQVRMAQIIEESLIKKVPSVIEAGTGTGKTLGYLVPVILSGKKSVVSTGTKNLQEQIFLKDIPLITKSIGIKVDSILMKGRQNYLCLYRYDQFFRLPTFLDPVREEAGKRIDKWLKDTEFADLAELPWLPEDDPLRESLSATSDQCLGSDCPHMETCFLGTLRKRAAECEIIIVNHHLFFADIMVKKSGFGEIIPRFQVAVFDEAHRIEEIATNYFGESLGTGQFKELVKDVEREIQEFERGERTHIRKHLNMIRNGTEELHRLFLESDDKGRVREEDMLLIREGPAREIRKGLTSICESLGPSLASRAKDLAQSLEEIFSHEDPNWMEWYEKRKKSMIFHASPLDVSGHMQEFLYKKVKTVVFTSATISTKGVFDYIRSRLGIPEKSLEAIYPSHFDFKRQSLLYIPRDLPSPEAQSFGRRIAKRITEILKISSGRALILFTSYLNLHAVHREIQGRIPYSVYRQGEAPRSILLERFRQDTNSVLLATGSFWQGVDVPGESLSCLIVDKLPFDSPGDPLVAARIESIRVLGGNPFMEYQLPSAIISLKQGLGRLIRNSSDIGLLAILDKRIITRQYGRFFIESLPDMRVSHDLADVGRFFE